MLKCNSVPFMVRFTTPSQMVSVILDPRLSAFSCLMFKFDFSRDLMRTCCMLNSSSISNQRSFQVDLSWSFFSIPLSLFQHLVTLTKLNAGTVSWPGAWRDPSQQVFSLVRWFVLPVSVSDCTLQGTWAGSSVGRPSPEQSPDRCQGPLSTVLTFTQSTPPQTS